MLAASATFTVAAGIERDCIPSGGGPTERFHIADESEILSGRTTDVYFQRTEEVLRAEGKDEEPVVAEVTTGQLPQGWPWGIFCGLEEAVNLLEGRPLDLYALPEGTLFSPRSHGGVRVPVAVLDGPYGTFARYETPLLGLLCQATAIATKAARVKRAAGPLEVTSFGVRRMHPALAPMIDRAAYVGGLDAVSSLLGADLIGEAPRGTMPHALTIVLGGPEEAFRAYDRRVETGVPRIALVDTYLDEVREALLAAESIPDLAGVRLDTPGSRRGDFPEIVRQVRWELDQRGYEGVKIYASGGLDEENIPDLAAAGAVGFGVGTSVSDAPTINFALDIVEVDGRPAAKRGKYSGRKDVFRCPTDLTYEVGSSPPPCPQCQGTMEGVLVQYLEAGKLVADLPSPREIRESVLAQLSRLSESQGEPEKVD
ncbi:MAG: nicotinate phosphoribosyltransferase [Candidatus Thermoplasmatota archaeon]|nr:nicotinate phosphoribosyltransferase [Candidatus Thermoplasmatota archaeon]